MQAINGVPSSRTARLLGFLLLLWLWAPRAEGATPELQLQLGHTGGYAQALAFTPDGSLLVSGGARELIVWEVATGRELRRVVADWSGNRIVLGRDGSTAFVSRKGGVTALDIRTGETRFGINQRANRMVLGRDGTELLVGTFDDHNQWIVTAWNTKDGTLLRTEAPRDTQNGAFSVDGRTFEEQWEKPFFMATALDYRARNNFCWERWRWRVLSPDGKHLAFNCPNNIQILSQGAQKPRELAAKAGMFVWSADGRLLFAGGETNDENVYVFEASTGKLLKTLPGNKRGVTSLALSPDGLLGVGDATGRVQLWDIATGKRVQVFEGRTGDARALDVSADGTLIVLGRKSGTTTIFDLTTGSLRAFPGEGREALSAKVSPDGKALATLNQGPDTYTQAFPDRLVVRDLAGGKTRFSFESDGIWRGSAALAFSPDSAQLLVSGKRLRLIDAVTGAERASIEGPAQGSFSPDGALVAALFSRFPVSHRAEVRLLDGKSLALVANLGDFGVRTRLAFSKDGQWLAVSDAIPTENKLRPSGQGTIRLYDLKSRQLIRTIETDMGVLDALAFDPSSRQLVAYSIMSQNIRVFAIAGGPHVYERLLGGVDGYLYAVQYTPDGKYLVTLGSLGHIKLISTATWVVAATMVLVGERDGVVITPDNHYLATKGALSAVSFRIGHQGYPFEQFDLTLNRPELVLAPLGKVAPNVLESFRKLREKRLRKTGFTEEMLSVDYHLPELVFASKPPVTTAADKITLRVRASDSLHALDRLNVWMNGVPIHGRRGKRLSGKSADQQLDLPLEDGLNVIQVSVHNVKGVESLRREARVFRQGKARPKRLHVLSIGVSDYQDASYKLSYAAKDARDIAALFSKAKSFAEIKVKVLADREVTKENILAARAFLKQSAVDDTVAIFVAGHGLLDESLDFYYATADIDFAAPAARGLPYEALDGLFDEVPARKRLLLMDTCHSGEVDKEETVLVASAAQSGGAVKARAVRGIRPARASTGGLSQRASAALLGEVFADLRRGSGAAVISSSSGLEFAFESPRWNNGVFTFAVIEGLRSGSADRDQNGTISVSELRDAVIARVHELTAGQQTPTMRQDQLDYDFTVY